MTTYTVATAADLTAALSSAVAGDIIDGSGGSFGSYTFSKSIPSGFIELDFDGATFTRFTLSGAQGLNFNRTVVPSGSVTWNLNSRWGFYNSDIRSFTTLRRSSDFTFQYCRYLGSGKLHLEASASITPACSDIMIDCCYFDMDGAQRSHDWFEAQGVQNLTIQNCRFGPLWIKYDVGTSGTYAHVDAIQIYNTPGHTPDGITIKDNYFWDDVNLQQQVGLWVIPINVQGRNVTITGNTISGLSSNGIMVNPVDNLAVVSGNLSVNAQTNGAVGGSGGALRLLDNSGATTIVAEDNSYIFITGGLVGGSRAGNRVISRNDLAWVAGGSLISDFVPDAGGNADQGQAWQQRISGMLDGSQDAWLDNGTLRLAGGTVVEPPAGLPAMPPNGLLNIVVTVG